METDAGKKGGRDTQRTPSWKIASQSPSPYLLFEVVYYEQLSATQQTCFLSIVVFDWGPSALTYDSSHFP